MGFTSCYPATNYGLDFVCQHADMVGFSFVETVNALAERARAELTIIAKIETN